MPGFPLWPATLEAPPNGDVRDGRAFVRFFATHDVAWVAESGVTPLEERLDLLHSDAPPVGGWGKSGSKRLRAKYAPANRVAMTSRRNLPKMKG